MQSNTNIYALPLFQCQEECDWKCKHLKCSKLCSEPCDRVLCKHSSTRILIKCNHQSIGVCGEKSPSLCRICHKKKIESLDCGNKNVQEARFIELQDCKHIIEVTILMEWLNTGSDSAENNSDGNSRKIDRFKKCPKCKNSIRRTKSLNNIIQASLRDIEEVKWKTCDDPEENKIIQLGLNRKTRAILKKQLFRTKSFRLRPIYANLNRETEITKDHDVKTKQALIELSNKFELIETLKAICVAFENRNESQQNVRTEFSDMFKGRIRMAESFIRGYRNCAQERDDIVTEMSFLQLMGDVIGYTCLNSFNDIGKKTLNDAFELANKFGRATDSVREEFSKLVTAAFEQSSGVDISLEEKRLNLRFVGFQRDYWLKCPRGHIYCVDDCDSAMESSKCPDCASETGGGNHSLEGSNASVAEIEDATALAEPTNSMAESRPVVD